MNHQALSSFIWSVADLLRGDYKQSEYGRVILPFRARTEQEHPRYMFYTFAWASKAGAFAGEGQSTIAHLTGEQLRKYRFPRPPLTEQQQIVHFLDAELTRLTNLRNESERAIGLLKERRSALIAAAVTGQVDVRTAVPQPNQPEELAA